MTIEDILKIGSTEEFDRAAMLVFRRQAVDCQPYRDYLMAIGIDPAEVRSVDEIPYLPIEIFKTHKVYCTGGDGAGGAGGAGETGDGAYGTRTPTEPEAIFTSSGAGASRHYVAYLADYEAVFTRAFELFYGSAAGWNIRALLPSYVERGGSSLVYMVEGLQRLGVEKPELQARSNTRSAAGEETQRPIPPLGALTSFGETRIGETRELLIGVSYALLDLAEEMTARGEKLPAGTVVMETGGMKGRREEMPKAQMHSILQEAFGVPTIHSEYGMCELTSQAYSAGGGIFRAPPWMRVSVRDLLDPFDVRRPVDGGRPRCADPTSPSFLGNSHRAPWGGGRDERQRPQRSQATHNATVSKLRGGINIIDLGNLHSCAFIQTGDMGSVAADGSFTIDGRIAGSDVRGCNLLVQ